jgi:hypothetical protein
LGRVAVAIAVCALAAGCSKTPSVAVATSPSATRPARPSTTAVITIVSPTQGQVVSGPTLHVVLTLTGATLVPPGTVTGVSPTQGHIHLSLDGQIVSMTSGTTQDLPVTPGPHILQAEFVANDHGPFFPRDIQTVHFTDQ